MLYSSLTPSLANTLAQNLLRNLRFQCVISFPDRPQLIRSNHLKKAYAYCSADKVSGPSIKVTRFKNLYVTDMIVLNPYLISGSVSTKSSVSIKKGTGGDSISCRDPEGQCYLV